MERDDLMKIMKEIENNFYMYEFESLPKLIEFYNKLSEKYQFDVSRFMIIKNDASLIKNDNSMSWVSKYNLIGIDYDFFEFTFNDNIEIKNIEEENISYTGRNEFNKYSYYTIEILTEKIRSFIKRKFPIETIYDIFLHISDKCFPNTGGYSAIQCCNEIAYTFAEFGLIDESLKYFKLIKVYKSDIADSTVGGLYKSAAEFYFDLGYKNEALIMIDMGLEIFPKLSVKKLRNSICN